MGAEPSAWLAVVIDIKAVHDATRTGRLSFAPSAIEDFFQRSHKRHYSALETSAVTVITILQLPELVLVNVTRGSKRYGKRLKSIGASHDSLSG